MGILTPFKSSKPAAAKQPAKVEVEGKKTPLTKALVERMYGRPSSFIDKLPWYEYQTDSRTILLDDGYSVGVVFEAVPLPTEGRSEEWLESARDMVEDVLADTLEEDPDSPWILQTYNFEDKNFGNWITHLREYPEKWCRDSEYTQAWLDIMDNHMQGIAKEDGLFFDEEVLGTPWGGSMNRTLVTLYRRLPKNWKHPQGLSPEDDINQIADKMQNAMRDVGVALVRGDGKLFYDWMLKWFNPRPEMTDGDRRKFYDLATYPGDEDLPYGDDLAESLFMGMPKSDADTQSWIFDDMHHQCIRVNKLRRAPRVGLVAGEPVSKGGDKVANLIDKLPPGSVVVSTIIVTAQHEVEAHIDRIAEKSRGESTEATYARRDCETAKEILGARKKLLRMSMAVYIRAETTKLLKKRNNTVCSLLMAAQLQPYRVEDDPVGLDAYILNLPFVFEPKMDRNFKATRPAWLQHCVNLSPLFGRHRGTGNPGMIFFNRGGEPLCFDPYNGADRAKNAHSILVGPTGTGKSATLNYLLSGVMAIHRPRLFLVEAGDSFGLEAAFFKANGLSVNRVQIKPGAGVSLAPFQDVHKVLGTQDEEVLAEAAAAEAKLSETEIKREIIKLITEREMKTHYEELSEEDQTALHNQAVDNLLAESTLDAEDALEGDDQRDILGEAEIIAKLMITGGEEEELKRLLRADRRLIRDAILKGARKATDEGRTTRTEDVAWGFESISHDEAYPEKRRERAFEMGESIRMYCDGFEGELFNSEDEAWPDVDVTIVDMATLARDGYQSQLALAYTSIVQKCNALAEKHQHTGRQLLLVTDEAHIITTNKLLINFLTKITKMWRKLGSWATFATQSLFDFPDDAAKMVSMAEFIITLCPPKDEVEKLTEFRPLTDEQKALMLSARKEQHKYVEGTVISDKTEALFRIVPPSLFLSLAGTEGYEKAQRGELMRTFGITEVEAAYHVAAMIDHARGIGPEPKDPVSSTKRSA